MTWDSKDDQESESDQKGKLFQSVHQEEQKRTDVHLLIHRQGRTRGEQRSVVSLLPEKELGGG